MAFWFSIKHCLLGLRFLEDDEMGKMGNKRKIPEHLIKAPNIKTIVIAL